MIRAWTGRLRSPRPPANAERRPVGRLSRSYSVPALSERGRDCVLPLPFWQPPLPTSGSPAEVAGTFPTPPSLVALIVNVSPLVERSVDCVAFTRFRPGRAALLRYALSFRQRVWIDGSYSWSFRRHAGVFAAVVGRVGLRGGLGRTASSFAEASVALLFWLRNDGMAIAARMPMIRITTRSSMRVKPPSSCGALAQSIQHVNPPRIRLQGASPR